MLYMLQLEAEDFISIRSLCSSKEIAQAHEGEGQQLPKSLMLARSWTDPGGTCTPVEAVSSGCCSIFTPDALAHSFHSDPDLHFMLKLKLAILKLG